MVRRPSLNEIPNDQEYLDQIQSANKSSGNLSKRLGWGILFFIIVYIVVGLYFKMDIHLMWIIGLPLFLIAYFLSKILVYLSVMSVENPRMSEYFIRHSLHRSEEINKSIDDLKNKN